MVYNVSLKKAKPSKYGGMTYLLLFKNKKKYSGFTWVYSECRNFQRWIKPIKALEEGREVILDNLYYKNNKLIDADSMFTIKYISLKEGEGIETAKDTKNTTNI